MKKPISEDRFFDSVFLMQPSTPILCTTKNDDGSDHVAPFGWVTPVSYKPPRVALALLNNPKKQHSLENIERTGEFVVNMPDIDLADKLVLASYWTMFGENKFDRSGFTRLPSNKVAPPGIAECKAHLECRVINTIVTGDHTLLIADVVSAQYDDDAFTPSLIINLNKYRPTVHLHNFVLENSQVHIFMMSGGACISEVTFPKEDDFNGNTGNKG